MMYKTICLELIQERPELYEELRSSKRLLPTMDAYAIQLKASHEELLSRLREANPGHDPIQLDIEALEIALEEFQERLPSGSEPSEAEPLSLDDAMNYLRRHTPPA